MTDLTPIAINDPRLMPDLRRRRNGSAMEFYKPENRSLQSRDADVSIKAPRRELFADLIDGKWYWVNDCPECNGQEPKWAYVKCTKHDVCLTCRTPRSELKEIPWGHVAGFRCKPCQDAIDATNRREALERVAGKDYDEWNYLNTDNVVCPHCETSYQPESGQGEGNETCQTCGGEFSVEVEYSVTYSTSVVGERVTLETTQ